MSKRHQPAGRSGSFTQSQAGVAGNSLLLIMLLVLIAGLSLVAVNRQNLFDWWRLRHYQPSPQISQLTANDQLTPYGRKVLYVNQPVIDAKTDFSKRCPQNGGEQTIILGCYHATQNGVDILSVGDSRLQGVEEVTLAHEMLHAAYDRLSSHDKTVVNRELQDFYLHDLHDARIKATIEAYKKSEPNDVVNEMHSVFGTEVAQLPPPLETYYKRYFLDRSVIAAAAARYQQEFTSRQAVIKQDDAQLGVWKQTITADEDDLAKKQAVISAERRQLDGYQSSGNIGAYNAGVPGYNANVNSYNQEIASLRNLITEYNQLVQSRNAVAGEIAQLAKDLSGNLPALSK